MALRLKSRTACPPNGFQFTQKETGWHLQTWDFNQLCSELQRHRQANPKFKLSLDLNQIATEVDQANAVRVLSIKGGEHYITGEGGAISSLPKMVLPRLLQPSHARSVGAKLNSGRQVLAEWLGEGGVPVPQEEAEARAAICAECPKNGKTEMGWFTKATSETIRLALEVKHDMGIQTSQDAKLDGCTACLCPLKLKVWTPLKHVINHMLPEVRAELDPKCWVLHGK